MNFLKQDETFLFYFKKMPSLNKVKVKKDKVKVTARSIEEGISRSDACQAFVPLLSVCPAQNEPLDVKDVDWATVFKHG